jgi:glycosyltransferase involved in cell wall biosynthesis
MMETEYGCAVQVIENRPYYYSSDQLDRQKLREILTLDTDDRIVIYVGYLSMQRGIDKLVTALRYLDPNIHVVIMGTGRISEFRETLDAIMHENQIEKNRVHFVGPFPPVEVIQYLCGADISAMLYQKTSDNMMFNAPNKLFQSIVAQVPIVASANATFPPLVEPNNATRIGVTVDESSPEAIAAAIKNLLRDEMQDLCRKNLSQAAVDVSWESEKLKLLNLYEQLL